MVPPLNKKEKEIKKKIPVETVLYAAVIPSLLRFVFEQVN
jgi:hypothetical protein